MESFDGAQETAWISLSGAQQIVAQLDHGLLDLGEVIAETDGLKQFAADPLQAKLPACRREGYPDLPPVGRNTPPLDVAHRFQLFEDGRQRVVFQEELLSKGADGLVVLFP